MSPFVNELIKSEVFRFKARLLSEFGGHSEDHYRLNVVSHKDETLDTSAVFFDDNYMGEMGVQLLASEGKVNIHFTPKSV